MEDLSPAGLRRLLNMFNNDGARRAFHVFEQVQECGSA
jgi:hypothetical protein